MSTAAQGLDTAPATAAPRTRQHAQEIQAFGHLISMPIALSATTRAESVVNLNQRRADSIAVRDVYEKHQWHVAGPAFDQLHLLFDKHATGQSALVDAIAERVQMSGGVSLAMAHDVVASSDSR